MNKLYQAYVYEEPVEYDIEAENYEEAMNKLDKIITNEWGDGFYNSELMIKCEDCGWKDEPKQKDLKECEDCGHKYGEEL